MTVGERIKARRKELNMTLLEVSTKIGVREATVQRYESGNIRNIKFVTMILLADVLCVSPAYLMGWDK